MSDAPPTRIGDYEIGAVLGAGGMAKVYRARHAFLDTDHAVKVLDPSYRANPDARQRFLDEAKIQAKHLDHPNIVKVTNIVATAEHAALVMELIDGASLDACLGELRDRPDELTRIMLGILDGVGHAHRAGIIHRDLKPANVLLARKGDQVIPKVTDFGIAKVSAEIAGDSKKSTHGDMRMGTLLYMSPEQIRRAKDVTPRSDVFSLGAMLYEMATGQVAFGGESDYDVMENIVNGRYEPPERRYAGIAPVIAAVIKQALDPDPARRFASCEEMAAALRGEARPVAARAAHATPAPVAAPLAVAPVAPPPAAPAVGATAQLRSRGAGIASATLPDGAVQRPTGAGTAQRSAQIAAAAGVADPAPPSRATAPPAGRTTSPGAPARRGNGILVAALLLGGLALGGVAIFLVLRGDDAGAPAARPTPAAIDAGLGAQAALLDAAAAISPDALAVAVAAVDAAAIVPAEVDAAPVTGAGEVAVAAPARVDAGVPVDAGPRRRPIDAGAPAAPVKIDAGAAAVVVAAPEPCVGLWSSGGMIFTVRGATGTCGKADFVERPGGKVSICSGSLRSCSSSGGELSAKFQCNWSEAPNSGLVATFRFACVGNKMTANVTFTHPKARTDRWILTK